MKSLNKYYSDVKIARNKICEKCIDMHDKSGLTLSNPIGPWVIPTQNSCDIVFVGKTARGNKGIGPLVDDLYRDGTSLGRKLLKTKSWPYWSYVREILVTTYGSLEKAEGRFGFTNIVKCNHSESVDKTTEYCKSSCIDKLQVIWNELRIMNPRLIIFLTHWNYDNNIELYQPTERYIDNYDRVHMVKNGSKRMPFWEREFLDEEGKSIIKFLRVSHPERRNKKDYIETISEWLNKNLNSHNTAPPSTG